MESAGGGTGTDALEDLGGDAGGVAARSPELALTVRVPDGGAALSFGTQVGVFAGLLLFTLGIVVPVVVQAWAALVGAVSAAGGTALVYSGGLEPKTFGAAMAAGAGLAVPLLLFVLAVDVAPSLNGAGARARSPSRTGTRGSGYLALVIIALLVAVSAVTVLAASRHSPWFPYPVATVVVVATVGFTAVVALVAAFRVGSALVRWTFRWACRERYRAGFVTSALLLLGAIGGWAQHVGWAQRPMQWAWAELELDDVHAPTGFADAGERLLCLGAGELEPKRARSSAAPVCSFLPGTVRMSASGPIGRREAPRSVMNDCFETLMPDVYERVVKSLAAQYPRETARDAASQAILDTCRNETEKENLAGYFYTAARNAALKESKRARRRREVYCDDYDRVNGSCPSPEYVAQIGQFERMVHCRLDATQQRLVHLWLAGWAPGQLGGQVGMAASKGKDTLFNALKMLAKAKDEPLTDCLE